MSITFVRGNLFLTGAQAIAVGLNASGRLDASPIFTALHDRCPAFISDYHRRGRAAMLAPGDVWVWHESQPWLVGMVVRDTPQGATRLRYVETAMLNLYHNWEREGLRSLALAPLSEGEEWPPVRDVLQQYLSRIALSVTVYEPDSDAT